ncbi:unnamed protein product [Adineta ricciae]|uniref:Metalloendopeptidase n=1 Tax=Adineta ricciae TaxID=249248 RepID=A0A815TUF8_ADIRI|nr:unnamed protein product [Adineta ricciae]
MFVSVSIIYFIVLLTFADIVDGRSLTVPTETDRVFIKNRNLFRGDILLHPQATNRALATTRIGAPWPNGIIPYTWKSETCDSEGQNCIRTDIPSHDSSEQATILLAMRRMEETTAIDGKPCIQFRPKLPSDNAYISIFDGQGCWAHLGHRFRTETLVSLGGGCVYQGPITHELMHTLDFLHEHQRPDRDQYIQINWENVAENSEDSFALHTDIKNGEKTIETKPPGKSFGQYYNLSNIDILSIRNLYQCFNKDISDIVSGASYKLMNINSNKVLDVYRFDGHDGANVQIFTDNGGQNQCWITQKNQDGTIKLIDSNTGMALDVHGGNTSDGAKVQVWSENETNAQKWRPIKVDNEYYKLINVASNKALNVHGDGTSDETDVDSWSDNGTPAQQWRFVRCNLDGTLHIVSGGKYKLVNINSNKALDVNGFQTANGANVEIYSDNGGQNQCWIIYKNQDDTVKLIDSNSGKALHVNEDDISDGANTHIWSNNESNAQKWRPIKVDNKYYKLINVASNKALNVHGGGTNDGTNVNIWSENDTPTQHWRLMECGRQ